MKAAAQIAVAFAPLLLACTFPFLRVVQGRRVFPEFAKCWGLLIFWMFVFTLVIPLGLGQIKHSWGREAFNWVPEGPALVAITFMGWMYAGPIVGLAVCVRQLVRKFKQWRGQIAERVQ
jgi:hypothetical protein